jgi:hypothetical protein
MDESGNQYTPPSILPKPSVKSPVEMISKIEKWEYSKNAAGDSPPPNPLAKLFPSFRESVYQMVREQYLRPSTQLPAREWAFGRVNLSYLSFPAEYSPNIVRFCRNLSLENESIRVCSAVAL